MWTTEIDIKKNNDLCDQLVFLLKKHSIGIINEEYKNVDSKIFLSQFENPLKYLHDKSIDPIYYERFNNTKVLEFLLMESFLCPIATMSDADIKDMDSIFFFKDQLLILSNHYFNFGVIKQQHSNGKMVVFELRQLALNLKELELAYIQKDLKSK